MKVSRLRSCRIILLSAYVTAMTSIRAVFMRLSGRINRVWVDNAIRAWINRLLELVDVNCRVVNPHNVKPQAGQATIIMCNHTSLYDIPLSYRVFPEHSIRMLSKKELSRIPVLGKGMTAAEFPFVDRKNRHQAIRDLESVRKLMESGIVVWIAPEGTRSPDGRLGTFKKGAFITAIEAGATIIPIGIRGASRILPARTLQFNVGETAEVHVGQPIDASQYTLAERDALVERVRGEMLKLVGE
ncbi:1-acyl-sn-glycerol-3-phosphate acetyltransferase [Legionella geestiana]|uniref:1-acyl-sn-glycerol-3-phosphate acetyltransferase n=1 Tax=Legionella geestiana TaxID=45065 RepID=A0A0W0TZR4_9GAMM|nr:lysophospholipid acyltransferase family protein [Legionella geestiana]KTD00975.1 1-acyl-sn-glycerol-3-phosphate acetyltransferase [Legionella geestiana]QBS12004.1 1-acyl-sn-glycerol-3-phosphate acyltransferase [Legionella geestiana]QDQ40386.1 1-acyl-sn-glycerol-3-phosphate acyltransferase [Legionella geestiana]STX53278.1 1-acyl-sn-glycerol-3-phosphate acetyltransferase [Legionella geestiana]